MPDDTNPQGADVPEAQPHNPDDVQMPDLYVGPPFAMSSGASLITNPGGCFATAQCDCGQMFKVDLLKAGPKPCPNEACGVEFTHMLVLCETDDDEMANEVFAQVLVANGLARDPGEGDDDDDDDDRDEDLGDDDDDDDRDEETPK